VDPAILEWSGPGIFSAKVFPLQPGKRHRIVVGYDVPLGRIAGDLEYVFDLPEGVTSKVVDLSVAAPGGAAVEAKPDAKAAADGGRSYFRFEDPSRKEIVVRVKKAGPTHLVGDGYFAADVAPALPSPSAANGAGTALFLLDTSLSQNPDRFNVWL